MPMDTDRRCLPLNARPQYMLTYWQNKGIISVLVAIGLSLYAMAITQIEQDLDDMHKTLNQGSELSLAFSFRLHPSKPIGINPLRLPDHAMYEQKRAKKKAIKALETFAVKAQ